VRAFVRHVVPPAAIAVLAFLAWPAIREAVRHHPYFAVGEILVRNARRVPADEVRAAAGIAPGMSIWDVDAAAATARLGEHPWIRSARIRRELPRRVTIQVREERPVAILTVDGEKAGEYYVAAHGRVFARVGPTDPRDFPYVSGVELRDGDPSGPRALRRALALLRVAGRGAGSLDAVSEVHVDRTRGLVVLPVRPAVPIEIGWGHFEARLARLPAVLKLWSGRETQIAGVSLVFNDEVIVRTRGTVPTRSVHRT